MGTNYYAHIIPTKERKERLKNLIDLNDFSIIQDEINTTYGRYTINSLGEVSGGRVHLGKRSGGWKFLWNPNVYVIHNGHSEKINEHQFHWVEEPPELVYTYPLTKKGIKSFIDRDDIQIYDEYGCLEDKEEFWDMALNWTTWLNKEAWDSKSYEAYEKSKNVYWKTHICSGELINLLKESGYQCISETCSDFYSDGLRFATYTDFS